MHVIRLYIDTNYRNQQIGSLLLENMLSRYSGCGIMYIPAKEQNTDAIRFYKRHGFVEDHLEEHTLFEETAMNVIFSKTL